MLQTTQEQAVARTLSSANREQGNSPQHGGRQQLGIGIRYLANRATRQNLFPT